MKTKSDKRLASEEKKEAEVLRHIEGYLTTGRYNLPFVKVVEKLRSDGVEMAQTASPAVLESKIRPLWQEVKKRVKPKAHGGIRPGSGRRSNEEHGAATRVVIYLPARVAEWAENQKDKVKEFCRKGFQKEQAPGLPKPLQ